VVKTGPGVAWPIATASTSCLSRQPMQPLDEVCLEEGVQDVAARRGSGAAHLPVLRESGAEGLNRIVATRRQEHLGGDGELIDGVRGDEGPLDLPPRAGEDRPTPCGSIHAQFFPAGGGGGGS